MTTPPTRLYQCPGCWSWGMWPTPTDADGSLECECGERLTRVDLRDPEAAVRGGAPAALREAAEAYAKHVRSLACDHSGAMAGTHTSCPEALVLDRAFSENTVDSLDDAEWPTDKDVLASFVEHHDAEVAALRAELREAQVALRTIADGCTCDEYHCCEDMRNTAAARLAATAPSDASEEETNG